MTRILVVSDTHSKSLSVLPKALFKEIAAADVVVHCGDYTSLSLLQELKNLAKRFVGVYGNMDTVDIRQEVSRKTVFDIGGKKIGVTHPYWGGEPFGIEETIAKEFRNVDLILFGHTHDAWTGTVDGITLLNPGQAYSAYNTDKATAGIVTIGTEGLKVEIISL